jgi:hypothetical protein
VRTSSEDDQFSALESWAQMGSCMSAPRDLKRTPAFGSRIIITITIIMLEIISIITESAFQNIAKVNSFSLVWESRIKYAPFPTTDKAE